MRHLTALLVVSGTLVLCGPALARNIHLKKLNAADLKQACEKAGGRFSEGPKRYGCGTDCHGGPGTDCIVTCEPGRRCVAQVMGGRRARTVEQALQARARH